MGAWRCGESGDEGGSWCEIITTLLVCAFVSARVSCPG